MKAGKKVSVILAGAMGLSLIVFGCSSEESGSKEGINIRGRLVAQVSGTPSQSSLQPSAEGTQEPLANYVLYCVTFDQPPVAGSGTADSSGYFEIKNFDVQGKAFGCFVLDEQENHVADIIFEKSQETGLGGTGVKSGTIILKGDTDFGTIVVDLNAKVAVVVIDNIVTAGEGEVSQPFDFTGEWIMECVYGGPGYADPSTFPEGEGPCGGMPIYLHRFTATDNDTGKTRYGVMVWDSKQAFESCGGVLGITQDEIDQDYAENPTEGVNVVVDDSNFAQNFTYSDDQPGFDPVTNPSWGASCTEGTNWPYDWNQNDFIGDYCKDLTDIPQRAYCFANCWWTDAIRENDSLCIRDRDFNWYLTPEEVKSNPSSFVELEWEPTTYILTEEFIYSSDNVGSFSHIEEREVHTGYEDSQTHKWIDKFCEKKQVIQVILAKTSDTTMEGDFTWTETIVGGPDADWCRQNPIGDSELDQGTYHFKVKFTKKQ